MWFQIMHHSGFHRGLCLFLEPCKKDSKGELPCELRVVCTVESLQGFLQECAHHLNQQEKIFIQLTTREQICNAVILHFSIWQILLSIALKAHI